MLLSGRASVIASAASDVAPSAIVVVADSALASIVDRPEPQAIAEVVASLSGDVNVLAQMADADYAPPASRSLLRRKLFLPRVVGLGVELVRMKRRHRGIAMLGGPHVGAFHITCRVLPDAPEHPAAGRRPLFLEPFLAGLARSAASRVRP